MQIEVNNISFSYVNDENLNALNNVSLNIKEGEFLAIVGKTGSGKSTFIQMLNNLLAPDIGYIKIGDFIITKDKELKKELLKGKSKEIIKKNKKMAELKKMVGLVFQFPEYQVFSETILKDVAFGPKNFGLSKDEANKVAKDTLNLVGLNEKYYELSPFEISGGERRRVGIAGVLASNPDILVLDEPTAGLDPNGKKEILDVLKKLNKEGKTVIIVTHDMDVVLNYASRVIVFNDSKLVEETTPLELFKHTDLKKYSLEIPYILKLINELRDKGFKIDLNSLPTIDELAKIIKRNLK